jgi:hypothetical protein
LKDAGRSVIEILSHIAPTNCDLPNNVRFVITSRPEHWADISTSKVFEQAVFKQRSLATESSVDEVHNFIVAKLGWGKLHRRIGMIGHLITNRSSYPIRQTVYSTTPLLLLIGLRCRFIGTRNLVEAESSPN